MTKEMCVNGCWWLRMYSGVMIISIAMVSWPKTMASTATRAGRWPKISRIGRPGPLAAAGPRRRHPPPAPPAAGVGAEEGEEGEDGERAPGAETLRDKEREGDAA